MGQYFKVANLDKREYLHPNKFNDGLKLGEFSHAGGGTMAALAIVLADNLIATAVRLLRRQLDGREPYAASVMPMARALAELASDPAFVLPAAEKMLREACRSDSNPHVLMTHGFVEIHVYPASEDGGVGFEGRTLLEAFGEARGGG